MVPARTSFVYVLCSCLADLVLLLLPGSSITPSLDAVPWLKAGAGLQIQSHSMWDMWWTQALWRFVRVVGFFPVSVISPVLHTHPFHLPITDAVWSVQCAAS
jgi:hypothetical protein